MNGKFTVSNDFVIGFFSTIVFCSLFTMFIEDHVYYSDEIRLIIIILLRSIISKVRNSGIGMFEFFPKRKLEEQHTHCYICCLWTQWWKRWKSKARIYHENCTYISLVQGFAAMLQRNPHWKDIKQHEFCNISNSSCKGVCPSGWLVRLQGGMTGTTVLPKRFSLIFL